MSKGILLFATGEEYVQQAILCALSCKFTNPDIGICLVTEDPVPIKFVDLFEHIIPIPWGSSKKSRYQCDDRWKLYHASPYDETIVLDADVLVLQDISKWWTFLHNYDIFYVSHVFNYRGQVITSDYYRKVFTANDLPSVYNGLYYFKKTNIAKEFYAWIELITNNWELFYGNFVKNYYPKESSMDVTCGLAIKILQYENLITHNGNNVINFVHMKSRLQNWNSVRENWTKQIGVYLTQNCDLIIGNYKQTGVFHYTENSFVQASMLEKYSKVLGI